MKYTAEPNKALIAIKLDRALMKVLKHKAVELETNVTAYVTSLILRDLQPEIYKALETVSSEPECRES